MASRTGLVLLALAVAAVAAAGCTAPLETPAPTSVVPHGAWSSARGVDVAPIVLPTGQQWALVEVRSPAEAVKVKADLVWDWDSRAGRDQTDVTTPAALPCLVIVASTPRDFGVAYGLVSDTSFSPFVRQMGTQQESPIHVAFVGARLEFWASAGAHQDGGTFFLFAADPTASGPAPHWNLTADSDFEWRVAATGPMTCGFGARDFTDGSGIQAPGVTQLRDLHARMSTREGGFFAPLIRSTGDYAASLTVNGTAVLQLQSPDDQKPHVAWVPAPSELDFTIDRLDDYAGNTLVGWIGLDGLPVSWVGPISTMPPRQ